MLLFTFQLNAQQVTWQCSNVIVENPFAFVSVWNDFMESDLGKSMSPNAIFQFDHSSSEFSSTHQVCWFSDNAADLDANWTKFFTSPTLNTAWYLSDMERECCSRIINSWSILNRRSCWI